MRFAVAVVVVVGACGSPSSKAGESGNKGGSAERAGAPASEGPVGVPKPSGPAEVGPHQDYPTPIGAGTDKLFFLEEPDRGPPAPAAYAPPPRATLAWTQHGTCELDVAGPWCTGKPGTLAWRVGRRKDLVIAESIVAGRVDETYVFEQNRDGTPKQRLRLDQRGMLVEAQLYAPGQRYSTRLLNGGNGLSGCGYMAYKLDARQRTVELGCLQWLGEPMLDTNGVATTRLVRDDAGAIVEESRFGIDGAAIAGSDGVHRTRYEHDAAGRVIAARRYGIDGAPAKQADGCFGKRTAYDARGLKQVTTCLDAAGTPMPDADGLASMRFTYSEHGCLASKRYDDSTGHPTAHPDGDFGIDYVTDPQCNVSSWTCVNDRGKPIACGPGRPATERSRRDASGRVVAETFLDAGGNPTGDATFGAHELRYRYDERGNQVAIACFGQAGEPTLCSSTGYHEQRDHFDDAGRNLRTTFYDPSERPTTNLGGAMSTSRYDNYDHLAEERTLGSDGKLFEVFGMAVQRYLYDATHRKFAMLLFDANGQPAHYRACFTGMTCPSGPWHALRYVRRGNGRLSGVMFFDANGQLITTLDCTKTRCSD